MGGLIARRVGSTHQLCIASTVTSAHGRAGEGCSFTPVTPEGVPTTDIAERFAELLESGTDAIVCTLRLTDVHPHGRHVAGVLLRRRRSHARLRSVIGQFSLCATGMPTKYPQAFVER